MENFFYVENSAEIGEGFTELLSRVNCLIFTIHRVYFKFIPIIIIVIHRSWCCYYDYIMLMLILKASTVSSGRQMIGQRKSSAPQSAPSSPSNRPGAYMPKLAEAGSVGRPLVLWCIWCNYYTYCMALTFLTTPAEFNMLCVLLALMYCTWWNWISQFDVCTLTFLLF